MVNSTRSSPTTWPTSIRPLATTKLAIGSLKMGKCVARPFPNLTIWWSTCGCTKMSGLSAAVFATKLFDKRPICKGTKQRMESVSKSATGPQPQPPATHPMSIRQGESESAAPEDPPDHPVSIRIHLFSRIPL